jgi:hypothetical protein
MVQEESDSEHNRLVRELKRQIHSLNLMPYFRGGVFSKGFTPDIVINIGGTIHDWVVIEVINSPRMLKHDLAGLYIVSTNLQAEGQSVRKNVVILNPANITHDQWLDTLPLVDQLRSTFAGIWANDIGYFTSLLKKVVRESLMEKIENANEELISRFFESHES